KILDKQAKAFLLPFAAKHFSLGNVSTPLVEQLLDQVALTEIQCDDAERMLRLRNHVVDGGVHNPRSLQSIHLTFINRTAHIPITDSQSLAFRIWRRKDDEPVVVEPTVGKRNERFVPRAVVPPQSSNVMKMPRAYVQDAF